MATLTTYTQTDVQWRTTLTADGIVGLADKVCKRLRYGSPCEDDIENLIMAVIGMQVTTDYEMSGSDVVHGCLTDTQLDSSYEYLAEILNIGYPPVGQTEIPTS